MNNLVFIGLILIIIAVLVLPFSVKKVEEELEIFLFIMGCLAVTISKIWSWHLIIEALKEPIPISLTVLSMGFLFKFTRKKIAKIARSLIKKFKPEFVVFSITLTLGLSSSIITAIIASLIFSEIISIMKFKRDYEIKLTVLTCFAIGTGAALTPVGEPLSTIVVSKLKGEPHNADFFYLIKNLAEWIIPLLLLFSILSSIGASKNLSNEEGLQEEYIESNKTIIYRAFKVYIFVMALVFLGNGINPLTNIFVTNLKPEILYWINSISAILDNATLAAAEIVPSLTDRQITFIIMGLIISGGFLIPGNIPNIICASKLNIKSKEWAKYGLIFGIPVMILCFIFLHFFA
jgi:predicted cation transporter